MMMQARRVHGWGAALGPARVPRRATVGVRARGSSRPTRFARWWMRHVGWPLPGPVQDVLFGVPPLAEEGVLDPGGVGAGGQDESRSALFTLARGHGVLPGTGMPFCMVCGGAGDVECGHCSGKGKYATRIGGGGVAGVVGAAKCPFCRAGGRLPCVVCRPEDEWMPSDPDPRAELRAMLDAKRRKRDKKGAEKQAKEARGREKQGEGEGVG